MGISWTMFVYDVLFLAEKIISLYSQVRRLGSVASSLFLCEWWELNPDPGTCESVLLNYILVLPLLSDIL